MTPERRAAIEADLAELEERERQLWFGIATGDNLRVMSQMYRLGVRRRRLEAQLEAENRRGEDERG